MTPTPNKEDEICGWPIDFIQIKCETVRCQRLKQPAHILHTYVGYDVYGPIISWYDE